MVSLDKFCPFERIASILVKIAYENSVDQILINWDGFGSSSVKVRKRYQDQNLGFQNQPGARLAALKADEVTGTVWFGDKKYRFTCKNDMLVEAYQAPSAVFEGKSLKNGQLATREPVCYPEAFRTTGLKMSMVDAVSQDEIISSARVYYQYVLEDVDKTTHEIIIHGPSNAFFSYRPKLGIRSETGNAVLLEKFDPNEVVERVDPVVDTVTLDGKQSQVSVILEYDGDKRLPFVIRQDMYTIRGTPLSCEAVLQILKIVAYIEFADKYGYRTDGVMRLLRFDAETNEVVIPLVQVSGHFCMAAQYWLDVMGYVVDCEPVKRIFDRYIASADELLIKAPNNRIALLTSNVRGTVTCFAYAFTSALVIDKQLPTTAFFELLNKLIDDGRYMLVRDNGNLEGNTSSGKIATSGEVFNLPVCGLVFDNVRRTPVNVSDLKEDVLYLVGGDFNGKNRSPGAPDHWLLAYYRNGGLSIVYDPLASAGRDYGAFVTSIDDIGKGYDRHFSAVTGDIRYA